MARPTFSEFEYDGIRAGCQRSADVIVPELMGYEPLQVLDVGCGEGWFASKFASLGVVAVGIDFGLPTDGAPGVQFIERDLTVPGSVDVGRVFGLVLCLEVAEHLPESRGPSLVAELCAAGNTVVFSAAIPGQGGHRHINERWASYWAGLFFDHGYLPDVELRNRIWDNPDVEPWYRQNLIVYAPERSRASRVGGPVDVVHPEIFGWRVAEARR